MIPLATAIFGLFTYIGYGNKGHVYLPIIGWLIFTVTMVTWRLVIRHIDRQLIGTYPRMLELERQLEITIFTRYYYDNLRPRLRNQLIQYLGGNERNWDYVRYEWEARRCGHNPYILLLQIWEQASLQSVTGRGHTEQYWAVGVIIVLALIVTVLSFFC